MGENQPLIRAGVLHGLGYSGILLDDVRNHTAQSGQLHSDNSTTAIYLTPVNEMDEMLRQYESL